MIGEAESERRFADALRPLYQDGVVALAGAVRLRKEGFRLLMAEQPGIFSRPDGAVEQSGPFLTHDGLHS